MRRYLLFIVMVALMAGSGLRAASKPRPDANAAKPEAAQANHNAPATGEEVFTAHCSRCHTPPMSISQRTTGTVIMHMRVRARLSREDEILLLKYMAP